MSLDLYFKPKTEQNGSTTIQTTIQTVQIVKKDDDVEVHPGYFVKKKLFDKMYTHQREGVKWLFSIHQQEKGCVLADGILNKFQLKKFKNLFL